MNKNPKIPDVEVLGGLDADLRSPPDRLASVATLLGLTDVHDIAWLSILLANIDQASEHGRGGIMFRIEDAHLLPERAHRVLGLLMQSGCVRERLVK